ncbi:MAG: hypothetical protein IPI67_14860 [Myxococcales bacterium]|nr:hypothetical protein [Myxococcales bacterium]
MSHTLVLLWLGATAQQADHTPDLDSWARARLTSLSAPAPDREEGARYDDSVASKLEELLDQARLAAASLDDAAARERLAEVDRTLRAHPELPQSAWLMAEALNVQGQVAARTDPTAEQAFVSRATALEGPRAPAFGETTGATTTPPELVTVTLPGAQAAAEVHVDGRRVRQRFQIRAGEHHVRVVQRGRLAWAGWIAIEKPGALSLPVPPPLPCSLDDFEGTRLGAKKLSVPSHVRCPAWAVARPSASGGIEIATCHDNVCGPLVIWKHHYGAVYSGPPQPAPEPGFPAWASWMLVGAGAAVLTTGVLWQAGAFDERAPGNTRFEFYGPKQNASFSPSSRGRR